MDQERIDAHQKLRLRRLRMAMLAWLLSIVVVSFGWSLGLIEFSPIAFALFVLLVLLLQLIFHVLIRSGRNLRLADPSMTLPQILAATLVALLVISRADEARTILLMLFILAILFGVFQLRKAQFILVALIAVFGYALIVLTEVMLGDLTRSTELVLLELAAFTIVMVWLAFLGAYVARLRRKLGRRNHELREATEQLKHLAEHDELTGLPNRRKLITQLEVMAKEASESGTPFCVAVLDLDHFKRVNDEYGHESGDEVLAEFAQRSNRILRGADRLMRVDDTLANIGRFGGEEFLVLLPGADLAGAHLAAERLRKAVAEQPFTTRQGSVDCTVSIGLAEHQPGEPARRTIARADKALYQAKESGRNRTAAIEQ